ncbi:DUF5330 domain-containing protein [Rhizobium sp. BK251]|uniref:DUF5330 domain-containing protein n=1 Tax=Rhizobium sp. BK251 TaxID=2512125 RepID=UPI0010505625|nr:DUF5330 domain-containing protein [Rhizobium sp. BK251]
MYFLIRTAFWFSLVLVALPLFSTQSTERLENDPKVEFSDAFSAASGAYDYLSGMCSEKPDVCIKGAETFTALGYRAREGARLAYEFLDSQFGDKLDDGQPAKKAAALQQPMPPMPAEPIAGQHADNVVTGTVATGVPVPLPKPAI